MNERNSLVSGRNLLLVVATLMALGVALATVTALMSDSASARQSSTCQAYKCDSGNGNGSESGDPGNSGGQNKGGDEIASDDDPQANPGGNNSPPNRESSPQQEAPQGKGKAA
jgi:hypothetical protein